jgi:hypothetical protein
MSIMLFAATPPRIPQSAQSKDTSRPHCELTFQFSLYIHANAITNYLPTMIYVHLPSLPPYPSYFYH